jgi:hypothetical protein
MGRVVEVTDQFGGYIRTTKDNVTGFVQINIFNARTNEETELLVDPENPEVLSYLEKVYQPIHLDILLGRRPWFKH